MRNLRTPSWIVVLLVLTGSLALRTSGAELPKQPQMGFEGHLVDVSRYLPGMEEYANVGMQVDRVQRGTPAWKMGLEPGDILVSIDGWRFGTPKGYLQALRAAGQRPSMIVVDARSQKLIRRACNLPHAEPSDADTTPRKPDTYQMGITLESDLEPNAP